MRWRDRVRRGFSRHRCGCAIALLLTGLGQPLFGQVAPNGAQETLGPGGTGTLVVTVKGAEGTLLPGLAMVNVYTQSGQHAGTATVNEGSVRFPDLLLGTYVVEASCVGYQTLREEAELRLKNDEQQVLLILRLSGAAGTPLVNGPPLLAPKVQKQLSKALEEIRAQRYDNARKNLASAEKAAPNHPDVNYLLGLLSSLTGNEKDAQGYWEKALKYYPDHYFSLLALGEASFGQGNLEEAKRLLNRAADANPSAPRPREVLAHIYLRQGDFEDAEKEAECALKLGKGEPNGVRLVLAKALIAQHEKSKAVAALKEFLAGKTTEAQADSAKKLLEGLSQPETAKGQNPTATKVEITAEAGPLPVALPIPPPVKWMPPNVDDVVPPVTEGIQCDLPAVLKGAERRVLEFVKSLDSFTATEWLQHQVLNDKGLAITSEDRKYNYLVSIKEVRPGTLDLQEYRNATLALDVFPDGLATVGLPSVILIFHPVNVGYYQMTCEGLSAWHGKPAWQVRFQQRDGQVHSVREYRVGGDLVPVGLKGRAWIAAESFEVVRMETDLLRPMPEIKLLAEHQAIDYGPVRFRNQDLTLWLPTTTDLYLDFHGRHVHRRHSYEDYLLFSVQDKQRIAKPREGAPLVQNER